MEVIIISEVDKENQITLRYDQITEYYINEHGKECLLVLSLLLRHYSIRKEVVFTMSYLYDKLKIPQNKQDRKIKIVNCINSLFGTEFTTGTNMNQLLATPYLSDKGYYLIVTDKEVDTILNYNNRIDKFNLFNTYITIKRYVNYNTGVSYPSINRLKCNTNVVSNNSIRKYIETLEELEMIVCTRSDEYIINTDGIRRPNNQYEVI